MSSPAEAAHEGNTRTVESEKAVQQRQHSASRHKHTTSFPLSKKHKQVSYFFFSRTIEEIKASPLCVRSLLDLRRGAQERVWGGDEWLTVRNRKPPFSQSEEGEEARLHQALTVTVCLKPDRATKFVLKSCFIMGVSSQYQHLSLAQDSRERQAHRQILIGRSGSQPRSNWTSWLSVTPPEHDALTAVNHLVCSRHPRQIKRNRSKKVQNVTAVKLQNSFVRCIKRPCTHAWGILI